MQKVDLFEDYGQKQACSQLRRGIALSELLTAAFLFVGTILREQEFTFLFVALLLSFIGHMFNVP